jgi:hypothetical protein
VLAAVALACTQTAEGDKVPLAKQAAAEAAAALSAETQGALDSGNVLFRKKDYRAALAQYQLASRRSPEHAAPWFGIYMVARAVNDSSLAETSLAEIRRRNAAPPHDLTDSAFAKAHRGLKGAPM